MNDSEINAISKDRYGVDVIDLDPTAALWLAEYIMEATGESAYRRIRTMRDRAGKSTAFPVYGSDLFSAM